MTTALPFPYPPMEARVSGTLPAGDDWQFEPKWDGFRCLVFKAAGQVRLQSKSGQPLERYFPEIVERIQKMKAPAFVLDGELVVPDPSAKSALSFDDLLQRIHPAESRVKRLARESPALLVVFDLLSDGKTVLVDRPLADRRARLEKFFAREKVDGLFLSPATRDRAEAKRWLSGAGGGLDGIVAKRVDAAYASGSRDAMTKVKTRRTADCVVGGFRYATGKKAVGSLLLGLYGDDGLLHHVGFTSSFKVAEKAALTKKIEALKGGKGFSGRAPGGPSRWSTERSSEWVPVDPKLVVEVEYDHFSQQRFRHGTKFTRWRPDKAPRQCTF
ncbi:MAG: ATP-dependent DNA ligase, partial [Vicinamibacterales bacterium]